MNLVNKAPWMSALETQLDALRLVRLFIGQAPPEIRDMKSWRVDERLLQTAAPFAWSAEATDAVVRAGQSIPLDTPLNRWNLETEAAWWHFEHPLPVQTITPAGVGVRALCFGWIKTEQPDFGLPVCAWTDGDTMNHPIAHMVVPSQTFEWERNTTLGEMLARTRAYHDQRYGPKGPDRDAPQIGVEAFMTATEFIARFVLAGLAWIGQRVVVTPAAHVERHRRKDFERQTGCRIPGVRVIQLRRSTCAHDDVQSGPSLTEWSCRWVVDGHWRNQACGPKHGDRKLTYIMPYVKGPDDKPLRTASPKVYLVSR